jgi:hypothetical protein
MNRNIVIFSENLRKTKQRNYSNKNPKIGFRNENKKVIENKHSRERVKETKE